MFSSPSFANHRPNSGTVGTGGTTLTYNIPVRQVMIVNDTASGGADLEYTINGNTDYATLKPQESISMWCRLRTLTIRSSTGTATYRTNALG